MILLDSFDCFDASQIPQQTGVYLYKDEHGNVLYCGKAKNLRSRVRSYFNKINLLPIKTQHLIRHIRLIDWIIVDTEVEALILENRLIKQYQPKYNIALKDGKTFAYIALSNDSFPRIFITRRPTRKMSVFGPYTDGQLRTQLQNMVIDLFLLRDCRTLPTQACLNFHIQRCSAPCIGQISQLDYAQQVKQAKTLLSGDIKDAQYLLSQLMQQAAAKQQYERALRIRNQLLALEKICQKQVIDRQNTHDQDVIAFKQQNEKLYILHFSVKQGVLCGKETIRFSYQTGIEWDFLRAFYQSHPLPYEIILNISLWQNDEEKSSLEAFLSTLRGAKVVFNLPKRGDKLALLKLAEKNLDSPPLSPLSDLQQALSLEKLPRVIECFDISNLGHTHIVSGMTQFVDMVANKKAYRHFLIKNQTHADDFASMREVITRRYQHLKNEHASMPDLILIDGGVGQVNAAYYALAHLDLSIAIIGLAKKEEAIYLPRMSNPAYQFDKNSPMMLLLRRIRDTTHRFAIGYNRKLRAIQLQRDFE